jgi:hypothetical protein
MDLNIKLYGLKYNFRKVQGCFYKNIAFWDFLEILELFY